jgi:hypothetical protein
MTTADGTCRRPDETRVGGAGVAPQCASARGRAKGMDGMSRTSKTAGLRERGPVWATVAGILAMVVLAVAWGAVPAFADTATVSTPTTVATVAPTTVATVAPTTVATVAPTTVATVSPTTVATVAPTKVATVAPTTVATVAAKASGSVGVRAYPPSPGDQCAAPIVNETDAWPNSGVGKCVAELILATRPVPTGDEGWRVGDVVELTLSIVNHGAADVTVSGVDAFIDFTLSNLELVTGSYQTTVTPVTPENGACDNSCNKSTINVSSGIFSSANPDDIVENYYYTSATDGRVNFSAGLRDTPATITPSTPAIVGTLKLRVKSNPTSAVTASQADTTYPIVLRNRNQATSGSSGWRNSAIVGVGTIGDAAMNIMGRAKDLPLPVERTEIALSLVPGLVDGKLDRRVGDVIPVDLKLTATTIIRNMTSLDASISFDFAKFVLVTSTGVVIAPDSTIATILNGTGFTFGDSGTTAIINNMEVIGNNHTQATSGSTTTSTIVLRIEGTALFKAKDDVSTVVRFYVRPKDNGATLDTNNSLTLGASPTIGIRDLNHVLGFQSYVTTGATSPATAAQDYPVEVKHTKITLALAVADPSNGTRGHRTGDTIRVDLTAKAEDLARNVSSLRTTISVPKANFVLVDGPQSKTFASAPVLKATANEAFGATTATHAVFDLTTSDTSGNGLITIDLPGTAIDLPNTTAKVIGSIYVRPRYNGISTGPVSNNLAIGGTATIGIVQANTDNGYIANALGFQVEVGGTTATGAVSVNQTKVDLKLVPAIESPLRIGDEVPVAIKVVPRDASYVNHLHTKVTVTGADFQVVGTGAFIGLENNVVTSLQAFTRTAVETIATNTYGSNTITFDVNGDVLIAGTTDVPVGTFYVRPRKKLLVNPDFVAANLIADEKQTGDVATIYGANLFAVDTNPSAASPAVTSALGTLGIGLEVRSPLADNPGLDYDGGQWQSLELNGTQAGAINVVDGRYLDVVVKVDGGSTAGDAKKVDDLAIDLTINPTQLRLKDTTPASGYILNPVYPYVTGTVASANSGATIQLRLESSALLAASTEVARLRFELASTPAGAASTAYIVLKVADTTVLKQKNASGIFNYDNYADPVGSATVGEYDHGPTATRQTPATLQVSTLLQGRTPENDASRFAQTMRMELRPVTSTTAAVRHLTVTANPESVRVEVTGALISGMQYDRATVKKPDDNGTKFAEAQFKSVAANATAPAPLADLEPGTYDVYLKGESSVAVVVQNVTFGPGASKSITGLVLREGDLDQVGGSLDTVGTTDFSAFTPKWGKVVSQTLIDEAATASDPFPERRIDLSPAAVLADLNRSGYVDIFDFSLLASNYGVTGPFCAPKVTNTCDNASTPKYVWGSESGSVSVARVGASASTASLNVAVGTADANRVVPVTVAVAPGSRAVDGVQVVLKTAPGATIVDAPNGGTFAPSESNPMPVILQQAWDAAKGLVSLGLGRAPSTGGLTQATTLGTVYVKVPAGFTGSPVTVQTSDGPFATTIAGAGVDLTGQINLTVADQTSTIDTGVVVPDAPSGESVIIGGTAPINAPAPVAPITVSKPVVAPSVAVQEPAETEAAPAPAPAIVPAASSAAPARSAAVAPAPAPASAARPSTTAPTRSPFAPVMIENRTKGTLTLVRPGVGAVELKTGTSTTTPDAFCPVARHNTYIRLEDTGIAGATFGVEAGGVLSWVSPDQAGCVDWNAISAGNLTFTKETIMHFQLKSAVPGALLWVLDGTRNGELYEVDAQGVANYVTADAFTADQDHFTQVWANVIPVSTAQIDGLAARGSVNR